MGNILPPSSTDVQVREKEVEEREKGRRTLIWEVHVARESLKNFSSIINAHGIILSLLVTVSYVGFLQPPKGWNPQNFDVFPNRSVKIFIIFNSLTLYSAICGLLVYLSCSYSSIMTLATVPIPKNLDDYGYSLVQKLRNALRKEALPSVRRNSMLLFTFLAISLGSCVVAFASAGFAAVGSVPGGKISVLLPLIAGVTVILYGMWLSTKKMWKLLNFEKKLNYLWECMGINVPEVYDLDSEAVNVLEPNFGVLALFKKSGTKMQHLGLSQLCKSPVPER